MIKKVGVVLGIFMLLIPFALGEIYYVKTDGNNSLDGLSYETAWQTISHAAQNSLSGSEIFVYGGDYNENTSGYGYLYISTPNDLTFNSIGEVFIKASNPESYRILHFQTPSLIKFNGFVFDGENSIQVGATSHYGNKIFENNKFVNLIDRGISLDGENSVIIRNNTFGEEQDIINFNAIYINNLNGSLIEYNNFFTKKGDIIFGIETGDLIIRNNRFGSENSPINISSSKSIRILDSDRTMVENNSLYLEDGYGIEIRTYSKNMEGPLIFNNTMFVYNLLNKYVIVVGSDYFVEEEIINPRISDNKLFLLAGDTLKHNLFVGCTSGAIIKNNYVHGGGYGIGVKNSEDVLILNNVVYNASRQAIVDKGSYNSLIINNTFNCLYGRCARVTNDPSTGRNVTNSTWSNNIFYVEEDQIPFEISSPVNPNLNNIKNENNTYFVGFSTRVLATGLGQFYDLFELQNSFDWDWNSKLYAIGEEPYFRNINISEIEYTYIKINFSTSESTISKINYGTTSLSEEINETDYSIYHNTQLYGLRPNTNYIYQITSCDISEDCISSEILQFRTKKSKPPHLPYFSIFLEDH
jgi:hypothetical protein